MRVAQTLLVSFTIALITSFPLVPKASYVFARAEDPALAAQQAAKSDPKGTIDGAKNPELISDEVAYRLVFLAVAEPDNATDREKTRAAAKIRRAGMNDDDVKAFLRLLGGFHKGITDIDLQLAKINARGLLRDPSSAESKMVGQLALQRDRLVPKPAWFLRTKG